MQQLVVIAGDDIGREVIPLAAQVVRTVLPAVRLIDAEAGWEEAWRTGQPISPAALDAARVAGSVLMGPERPFEEGSAAALDHLATTLDLFAALYPLQNQPLKIDVLLVAEHGQSGASAAPPEGDAHLSPERAWAATRLGNLAGQLLRRSPGKVALAHDSEEEFAHAVAAGIGEDIPMERLDAVYLINDFPALAQEFDLILTSAPTSRLIIPHAVRHIGSLPEMGRLLIGPRGCVATPVHGPLREQVGWGFTNPLGALHAALALLRYGWQEEAAARRLEEAIRRGTARRRTPDCGGLHTMYEVVRAILTEL